MSNWDAAAIERAFAQFVGNGDPDDPKERRRLKLVAAATELFIKQGYRKTSVDEVARRAGVAKGTVYLYFKTKGELLLHAIVEEKRRHIPKLAPVFDGSLPEKDRLRYWLRGILMLAHEMPLTGRLMGGDHELMAALDDLPAGAMAKSQAMGIDFISGMISMATEPHRYDEQELRDRAVVLRGLTYFTMLLTDEKVRDELTVERYATVLADMIADGLRPRGESP